jgi:hypothetical protein
MTTKGRVEAKALKLGYTVNEIDGAILLEAPKGYSFWDDFHELNSYYEPDFAGDKANAWADVYDHIGKAEPCQIEECDWCNGL